MGPLARMGRLGRSFVFIVSLAGLLGLPVMTPAFAAPPEVQGLEDGIAELSDWLGSLGDEAGFDEDLPLLDGTVGESLDLLNALDQSLHDPVVASDAVDVAALASAIDGFDDTSVTVGEAPDTFDVAATFATTSSTSAVVRVASPRPRTTPRPSTAPITFAPASPSMRRSRRSDGASPNAAPIAGAIATPTAPSPRTIARGT